MYSFSIWIYPVKYRRAIITTIASIIPMIANSHGNSAGGVGLPALR